MAAIEATPEQRERYTVDRASGQKPCLAWDPTDPKGFECTRPKGHDGEHEAWGSLGTLARVWKEATR